MVVLVTDSSVGYNKKEIAGRKCVQVVPLIYSVDGVAKKEKLRGENGNFVASLEGKKCRTTQPSVEEFEKVFKKIVAEGNEVLCVTISPALSGTFSSATIAAKRVDAKVKVVNSSSTACGMHLLIDEAVNMIIGGLSLDEIASNLDVIKEKINTVFTVEKLKPLVDGGRFLNHNGASTSLNNRPVLCCSERIDLICNTRGVKEKVEKLIAQVPDKVRRIFIMKTGEDTDISKHEDKLKKRFPNINIHVRTLGPVHTIHLGLGAVGISYITN